MPCTPPATASGRSGTGRSDLRSVTASGFTLFELMVVLLVISLAGLLVMPNMRPLLDRTRLESSVRRTASFLDAMRGKAVLEGEVVVLSLDADEGELTARRRGGEEALDRLKLPGEGVEVTIEPEEVAYFPQGHSSGGAISFRRRGEEIYRVEVGSFTGLSRIGHGEGR